MYEFRGKYVRHTSYVYVGVYVWISWKMCTCNIICETSCVKLLIWNIMRIYGILCMNECSEKYVREKLCVYVGLYIWISWKICTWKIACAYGILYMNMVKYIWISWNINVYIGKIKCMYAENHVYKWGKSHVCMGFYMWIWWSMCEYRENSYVRMGKMICIYEEVSHWRHLHHIYMYIWWKIICIHDTHMCTWHRRHQILKKKNEFRRHQILKKKKRIHLHPAQYLGCGCIQIFQNLILLSKSIILVWVWVYSDFSIDVFPPYIHWWVYTDFSKSNTFEKSEYTHTHTNIHLHPHSHPHTHTRTDIHGATSAKQEYTHTHTHSHPHTNPHPDPN